METRPDRGAKRGSAGDASQRHKRLELLETIADHLGVGALLLGPDGDLDIQTRQAERFAAILGKGWYRHCMRQDLKEQVLNVEDERQKGYSFEISRLSLYREDDVLLIRNITESVPKESERDCRRLFEQCPVGQAIHRLNGDLVECNNAYAEIFGRTPEEMLGLSYGDLTPKEYFEGDQRQLEKLRNTGRYGPVEKELVHKKGHRVAVRLRGKLLNRGDETLVWSSVEDISETQAVQRALQETQSRFSLFMDNLPAAVFIKDSASRVLYVNRYLRANFATGVSPGPDNVAHFSADNSGSLGPDDRRALSDGRYDFVEQLTDLRGRKRTFRTLKFAIPREQGEPPLLGGIAWDISEALAATESLARSKRRYREIFEIAEEGIWLIDAEGRTAEVNQRMARMLGYTIEEMRGRHQLEFVDEAARAEAESLLDRHREGISEKFDLRLRTRTGADLWTIVSSAPMYDPQGDYAGALRMVTDITERKRAEEAVRKERDFAERLIETAPVIVLVLDQEGRIVRFNPFMRALSGFSLEEVKGRSWIDVFLPECADDAGREVAAEGKPGVPANGDLDAIVTRDGKERLISWYATTLRGFAGESSALLAIGLDVTEQKAKDAQLVQAQKMEMLGQLTGGLAHDFNNLLTVILGNLELLTQSIDGALDPDLFELLQDSYSAAQDGAELIRRLLAFSRKEPLQRRQIDLPAFLSDFKRLLERTLGADIAVEVEVAADLDLLPCDPPQLESALLNLALNARDAMPRGGRISIRAMASQASDLDPTLEPGTYAELSVVDTGTGMAPEQLTRAIEPFYTTKGSKHGSGLGLSMVFGFCEQAGGRFGLASEPGAGTKATILLPLNGRVDRETGETSEASPRTASAATTGKVLLVEDEERVRKLAGRYLRDLGYDLLTAENGERAIEVLRSVSAIKLVFSDIVMPGEINGYDLYWLIRRQWPETKVLLTTGLRSEEIDALAGAVESPVPIALSKPYTKEQLAEAIRTLFAA